MMSNVVLAVRGEASRLAVLFAEQAKNAPTPNVVPGRHRDPSGTGYDPYIAGAGDVTSHVTAAVEAAYQPVSGVAGLWTTELLHHVSLACNQALGVSDPEHHNVWWVDGLVDAIVRAMQQQGRP